MAKESQMSKAITVEQEPASEVFRVSRKIPRQQHVHPSYQQEKNPYRSQDPRLGSNRNLTLSLKVRPLAEPAP